jgi:hypothetical protein
MRKMQADSFAALMTMAENLRPWTAAAAESPGYPPHPVASLPQPNAMPGEVLLS